MTWAVAVVVVAVLGIAYVVYDYFYEQSHQPEWFKRWRDQKGSKGLT